MTSHRIATAIVVAYPFWLAMLTVHELGHIVNARLSGGRTQSVSIPLVGFSQTVLSHNPRPLFVAAGGAFWGSVLPLALAGGVCAVTRWQTARGARFARSLAVGFAGFCCIANGGYLAAGGWLDGGDAADLRRLGCPLVVLVMAGVAMVALGLLIWHRSESGSQAGWCDKGSVPAEPRQ